MIWVLVTIVATLLFCVPFGLLFRSGWRRYFIDGKGRATYDREGEGLMIGGGVFGGATLLVGLVVVISMVYSGAACARFGRNTGYEAEWQPVGGCYLTVEDRSVPESWLVPVVEGERLRLEIVNPEELGG